MRQLIGRGIFPALSRVAPTYRLSTPPLKLSWARSKDRFFARRSAVFDLDPSTMLRVMVRYSNHEAQTRRELASKPRL